MDPPSHSRNGRSWICSGEFTLQVPIQLIQRTKCAQADEAPAIHKAYRDVSVRYADIKPAKIKKNGSGRSILPQLHDAGDIPRGKDPPDVVKVSHENAAISSASQRQGGQKFVAFCLPITAGAGNATATAISCNIRFNSIKNKSKTPAETRSTHRSLQRSTLSGVISLFLT